MNLNSTSSIQSTRKAVVAVVFQDGRFLVIRRSQAVRAPGQFCFPGGGVEIGETLEQAVVREMQEELNAGVRPIRQIWQSRTLSGFELNWLRVDLLDGFTITANPHEVQWWGWCTPQEFLLLDPMLPTNKHFMDAWAKNEFEL